jgi:UDP-2,3-diacylglucosamine hydrolase
MATYFISDLHLTAKKPEITERFLKFLREDAIKADALYILGDLFDVWMGDDQVDPHTQTIIEGLYHLHEQGIPLYFMRGNRDFLIGDDFAHNSGCVLLPDPTRIMLYGKNILLTHGDQLCTLDKKYQTFRRFVRRPMLQSFFLKLPMRLRALIAGWLRKQSKRSQTTSTYHPTGDVALETVYGALRHHDCHTLIHGHTHQPNIHDFILDEQPAKRIVLGDWSVTAGSVLSYDLDTITLKTFA